jgi:hypothetical protein
MKTKSDHQIEGLPYLDMQKKNLITIPPKTFIGKPSKIKNHYFKQYFKYLIEVISA